MLARLFTQGFMPTEGCVSSLFISQLYFYVLATKKKLASEIKILFIIITKPKNIYKEIRLKKYTRPPCEECNKNGQHTPMDTSQ